MSDSMIMGAHPSRLRALSDWVGQDSSYVGEITIHNAPPALRRQLAIADARAELQRLTAEYERLAV